MRPLLRYRVEPSEAPPERAGDIYRRIERLTRDRLPPAFRLSARRLSSGLVLDFETGGEAFSVRVLPDRPGTPRLVAASGAAISVDGDDAVVRAALPAVACVRAALSSLIKEGNGAALRDALDAAAKRHDYRGARDLSTRGGGSVAELRLLLACNQRCFFCSCDENAPNLARSKDEIEEALRRLFAEGARTVVFSGGEPTLHSGLESAIALAKSLGFSRVSLQTNSMLLAEGRLAARLAGAGLDELFASLHGSRADAVDAITGTPGGFRRTLRGLDAAAAAGIQIMLNFVATRMNLPELPSFARFALDRFGPSLQGVTLSFMAPVASARDNLDQMPRLREVSTAFRAAIDEGRRVGVRVRVAGVCGVPLCQLPGYEASSDEHDNIPPVPIADDRRFVAACAGCRHRDRCSGFWKVYLERFGEGELHPADSDADAS